MQGDRPFPGADLALAEQEAHDLARILYAEHFSTPFDDAGPYVGEVYVRRAMGELARRRDAVKAERAACLGDIEHEVGANGMVVLTLMLRVTGGSAGQVDELARRLLDLGLIQAVVDEHELDDLPVMSVKHSSHAVK